MSDWKVINGCFIGKVLVRKEVKDTRPIRYEDSWLPYSRDLRDIGALKQDTHDTPDQVALYHGDTFVGTVNCSFDALLPHWLRWRHIFDQYGPKPIPGVDADPMVVGQDIKITFER